MSEYKFNFAVSAEISPETIAEMIKTTVEKQTGRKVRDVIFKVSSRSNGYRNEPESPTLSGCTVHFE
jgi:hypothetical protein